MKFITSRFGEIKYSQQNVITIFEGLLGYSQYNKYIIINQKKQEPFQWLQSVENGELAFVVTNPYIFKPDFKFSLKKQQLENLDVMSYNEIRVLSIVVIPQNNFADTSINLQSPIFINIKDMIGKQIVLHDRKLPVKYFIWKCQEYLQFTAGMKQQ